MNPIPSADRLFAARLYAVTFYLQRGFPAKVAAVAVVRRIRLAEAERALAGLDYDTLAGAA